MNRQKKYKTLTEFPRGSGCCLCGSKKSDTSLLGEIYQLADLKVHYFCVLSSSKIEQSGNDDQGILGFISRDIRKEITRGKNIKCVYCKKKGATVQCFARACNQRFHLPCGLKNGSLHQYFDEFKSFCSTHKPIQKIPVIIKRDLDSDCPICCLPVSWKTDPHFWPPCCRPKVLLHKPCLQSYALNSGYLCKCPLCNNDDTFRQALKEFGVYLPDQDASWLSSSTQENLPECLAERTPGSRCLCPKGVRYSVSRSSLWSFVSCLYCGSGIHRGCLPRPLPPCEHFKCDACADIQFNHQSPPRTVISLSPSAKMPRKSLGAEVVDVEGSDSSSDCEILDVVGLEPTSPPSAGAPTSTLPATHNTPLLRNSLEESVAGPSSSGGGSSSRELITISSDSDDDSLDEFPAPKILSARSITQEELLSLEEIGMAAQTTEVKEEMVDGPSSEAAVGEPKLDPAQPCLEEPNLSAVAPPDPPYRLTRKRLSQTSAEQSSHVDRKRTRWSTLNETPCTITHRHFPMQPDQSNRTVP